MESELGVVYVVEDDPDMSRSIAWVLESVGYRVQIFATADEFLRHPLPTAPVCLVIDLVLPGTTGLKLCRELIARRCPCAFVVVSGNGDINSAVEAMRLGAVNFLEKPFGRGQLLEAVDSAMKTAHVLHEDALLEARA